MPQWWSEPDQENVRFYRGRSMRGTFRPGDRLIIETVAVDEVRPGDVVVFRASDRRADRAELVHRVVAGTPPGWIARGDCNPCSDATRVTADNLVGRVTHVEGSAEVRRVRGGRVGLWRARWLHAWLRARSAVWGLVKRLGRPVYRRLRSSGIVRRFWRPTLTRLRLNTAQGPLVKYVHAGRTVGRWWPERHHFEWKKPYDLVIPPPREPWKPGSPT